MRLYTPDELMEGLSAMDSLIRKCEKAQTTLKPGTPQWTTLSRRLAAFRLAHEILEETLADLADAPPQTLNH